MSDFRDGLEVQAYNQSLGPQVFVAQDKRGNKRNIRVKVRRELPEEQRSRQLAFAADRRYIARHLRVTGPRFIRDITLGA
jgi:hypothetical protein